MDEKLPPGTAGYGLCVILEPLCYCSDFFSLTYLMASLVQPLNMESDKYYLSLSIFNGWTREAAPYNHPAAGFRLIKANFHYAILLSNQLASWFASTS